MMKKLRYCPELNKVTGGITSTLVMMQLEFWFEKNNGDMFFKFLEPCEDPSYRKGDSWCEELGFSKGEFRTAFARIGKVYKSKKEFNESKDKFDGKLYLSYFDRIKRMTFYMRNHQLANYILSHGLEVGAEAIEAMQDRVLEIGTEAMQDRVLEIGTDTIEDQVLESGADFIEDQVLESGADFIEDQVLEVGVGFIQVMQDKMLEVGEGDMEEMKDELLGVGKEDREDVKEEFVEVKKVGQGSEEMASPISIDYFKKDYPIEYKSLVPYEQIITSYHEICEELPRVMYISDTLKARIDHIWQRVDGKLERIIELFHKVRASDFLSGRIVGKFWKANLEWVMKWEKFEDILRDKYAQRYQSNKAQQKVPKFNRMASHNWDFKQLEALEQAYIEQKAESFKTLKSPWLTKAIGISEVCG